MQDPDRYKQLMTVSSVEPNTVQLDSFPSISTQVSKKKLSSIFLTDCPGHPKLQYKLHDYIKRAFYIICMFNGNYKESMRQAAQ